MSQSDLYTSNWADNFGFFIYAQERDLVPQKELSKARHAKATCPSFQAINNEVFENKQGMDKLDK